MAISGLKTWANGDALTPTNMNADKAVLEAKFNGGIETGDLADGCATNAKLANDDYEIVLNLSVIGSVWDDSAVDDVLAMAGLPDDTNDEYTLIKAIEHVYCGTGGGATGDGKYRLEWGYFNAGAWTTEGTVVVDNHSLVATAATKGYSAALTPAVTSFTQDTTKRLLFAIVMDADDTTFDDLSDILTVSLKLKRTSGLRS